MIFGTLRGGGAARRLRDAAPSMFGGGFVRPGFFEALQIPVKDGRVLGPRT